MEGVIINELSLNGQFLNSHDFWKTGMPSFHRALKETISCNIKHLFKKSEFYQAKATPNETLYSLLTAPEVRIIDEARLYKSILARAIHEDPFWDCDPKQDMSVQYFVGMEDVSRSSVAEATARPVCLLSFIRSSYEKDPIIVQKDGVDFPVRNVWDGNQLYAILFELGKLSLKEYIVSRFSGLKLDFSLIDEKNGFFLINHENQTEFIDSFRKFIELDWHEIVTDKGLDYKSYNKTRKSRHYFTDDLWQKDIKKFRITERNRCFGYVDNGVFYVLRFDLDHELSNVGLLNLHYSLFCGNIQKQ